MKMARSQRFRTPPGAPKPRTSVAAKPTRKLAHLVRIERVLDEEHPQGWPRKADFSQPTEVCMMRAFLSDGRTFDEPATVTYAPKERERALEQVFKPFHSEAEAIQRQTHAHQFEGLIWRRERALQEAYGRLQQRFGNGVPWSAPKRAKKAAA